MRGSVVKRGNKYAVKVELPPDPVTGKRRQKWHSGYATKKEAEQARTAILRELDTGSYVEPTKATLADYLDEWLVAIKPTVRDSTHHSYARNVRLHVLPTLGTVPLARVDAGSLNALYARLLAGGKADGSGLSPRTVRYIHTILHRAFKDAVRWGRLARNPADAADPPKASAAATPELQTWPAEVLQEFLSRSRGSDDRLYAAWLFLATTGCRRGEALGLRWSDLDLTGCRAQIVQTVIAVNHDVRFGEPKTAKGRRAISLDPVTVAGLQSWRRRQLEERIALGPGYRDHDLVFAKVTGEPLHPERFTREFQRRVERWNLPKLTLHGLRHTWATQALAAGVHPRVVQERLGHAAVSITLGTYSHVTPTLHDEAAALVASKLLGDAR
jgi:integrase